MRRLVIFFIVFLILFIFGCTVEKPIEKPPAQELNCCNRTIAEKVGNCSIVNLTEKLTYFSAPGSCDLANNVCNITIVQKIGLQMKTENITVPICTGEVKRTCVEANCSAMVCGDFIYRPRLPQAMPTEEEIKAGAALPMTSEEDTGALSLYKADCRFLPMDENLSKILERTGSLVNSFRFGIGSDRLYFEDYEKYKYLFPPSDMFCTQNPQGKIDRYPNYLDMKMIPLAYSPRSTDFKDPTTYISKHECIPYTGGSLNPEETKEKYPFLYSDKPDNTTPNGYRTTPDGNFDTSFYARALTAQFADLMFNKNQKAPFECTGADCMSGYCNKQTYHRSLIVKNDGSKVPVECYSDMRGGRKVVACAVLQANKSSVVYRPEIPGKDFWWDKNTNNIIARNYYQPISIFGQTMDAQNRTKPIIISDTDTAAKCTKTGDGNCFMDPLQENWNTKKYTELVLGNTVIKDNDKDTVCGKKYTEDSNYIRKYNGVAMFTRTMLVAGGIYRLEQTLRGFTCEGSSAGPYGIGYEIYANEVQEKMGDVAIVPNNFEIEKNYIGPQEECREGYIKRFDYFANKYFCYKATILHWGLDFPPAATIYFFNMPVSKIGGKDIIGYGTGNPNENGGNDFIQKCNMTEGKDYTVIQVGNTNWLDEKHLMLMQLANALLMDNLKELEPVFFENKSDEERQGMSIEYLEVASIPWLLAIKTNPQLVLLTKPEYKILDKNNVLGLKKGGYTQIRDVTDLMYIRSGMGEDRKYVELVGSRYIYVIHSLGDCKVEEGTVGLPKLEEYGWCEPCTYTTMAYGSAPKPQGTQQEEQTVIEHHDMLVNYLKNGILPIVDVREAANYVNMADCSIGSNGELICQQAGYLLNYYALLEKLFKDNKAPYGIGPVITIVGSSREKYAAEPHAAIEQASPVKQMCQKCLTAIPFFASADSYASDIYGGNEFVPTNYVDMEVQNAMKKIWTTKENGVEAKNVLDAAVIFFPIDEVMSDYAKQSDWNSRTAKEKADIVVDRMFNYAWSINSAANKTVPVVIIFSLKQNSTNGWPAFSSKDDEIQTQNKRRFYADFFSNIYLSRDKLRKAGVIGLVYAPFSTYGSRESQGIIPGSGVVTKYGSYGDNFCAFQEGTYDFVGVSALTQNVKMTVPEKECDIFKDRESIAIPQILVPSEFVPSGQELKAPSINIFDCNMTCYNETNSCSVMCINQSCQIHEFGNRYYPSCQQPSSTEPVFECSFSNARNIASSNYKETAKCTNAEQQVDCALQCNETGCSLSCNPSIDELMEWNEWYYFDVSSIIPKECEGSLAPNGSLYCQQCLPGEACYPSSVICEDGTTCVQPAGLSGPFKCPQGVISRNCRICNETQDSTTCLMRRYGEPTAFQRFAQASGVNFDSYFKNLKYRDITEADVDILGMLPKEEKCCLLENGTPYTYKRVEMNAISTVPIVFSPGQPTPQAAMQQDCQFVDPTIVKAGGGIKICGITKTPDEPLQCKKNWSTYNISTYSIK